MNNILSLLDNYTLDNADDIDKALAEEYISWTKVLYYGGTDSDTKEHR